jgi:hypothetical protein
MGRASHPAEPEIVRTSFRGPPALFDFFRAAPAASSGGGVCCLSQRPVVDLGCGSGLGLSLLARAVRPRASSRGYQPRRLPYARRRVEARGWRGVELVEAFAQDYRPSAASWRAAGVNRLICSPVIRAHQLAQADGRCVAQAASAARLPGLPAPSSCRRRSSAAQAVGSAGSQDGLASWSGRWAAESCYLSRRLRGEVKTVGEQRRVRAKGGRG